MGGHAQAAAALGLTDAEWEGVRRTARVYSRRIVARVPRGVDVDADDLYQAAMVAVLDAAPRYDRSRSLPGTFFGLRMWGEMMERVRQSGVIKVPRAERQRWRSDPGKPPMVFSLFREERANDPEACVDGGTPGQWGTTAATADDPHDDGRCAEFRAAIRRACPGLTYRERFLLKRYYCDGWTLKEIGAVLELSESRCSQMHKLLVRRVRSECPEARVREALA